MPAQAVTAAPLSPRFYPLEQMFALTPPRGVPLQRAEPAESQPTTNRHLFIYLLSEINSLSSPTAQKDKQRNAWLEPQKTKAPNHAG